MVVLETSRDTYKVDEKVEAEHVFVVLRVTTDLDAEFGCIISSGSVSVSVPMFDRACISSPDHLRHRCDNMPGPSLLVYRRGVQPSCLASLL